ncbi:MAG TPA: hypothetical protein VE988_05350 [Gemmataceae bacterium]|nr:hypothetical protein [Gemmataceae bacterium]
MSTKPAHKIRDGALQVTIWRNTGDKGNWYSVVPTRSYKPDDGDWQETDSLNGDDCLAMAELIREAYAWIKVQRRAESKARREAEKAKELEQAAA